MGSSETSSLSKPRPPIDSSAIDAHDAKVNENLAKERESVARAMSKPSLLREIVDGVQFKEDFKIKEGVLIKIRTLSALEVDEATMNAMSEVSNYPAFTEVFSRENDDKSLSTGAIMVLKKFWGIHNAHLVYAAVKDFYDDATVGMVKAMVGMQKVAMRVREISVVNPEKEADITSFRAQPPE